MHKLALKIAFLHTFFRLPCLHKYRSSVLLDPFLDQKEAETAD